MKPINELTDAELNEEFSVEVAGYVKGKENTGAMPWYPPGSRPQRSGGTMCLPKFSTSADAVLPWLEKVDWCATHVANGTGVRVTILNIGDRDTFVVGDAKTFAQAACIALIEQKRMERE